MNFFEKVDNLRQLMKKYQLDSYIIQSKDPHQSEYVPLFYETVKWISGFSGSAGTIVITSEFAGLWTDSRYFIQAQNQLKNSPFVLMKPQSIKDQGYIEWIKSNLPENSTIGLDGKTFSLNLYKSLSELISKKKLIFNTRFDLISEIWDNRPKFPDSPVFEHEEKFCGISLVNKISNIRGIMKEEGISYKLISSLDEIAWTLNLRGNDIKYNPLFLSYLVISSLQVYLFIGNNKIKADVKEKLDRSGVIIKDYNEIEAFVNSITEVTSIHIDPHKISVSLYNQISKKCKIVESRSFISGLKAVKSSKEIENLKNAFIKEGVAMVKLLIWLEKNLNQEVITETLVSEKLEQLRRKQEDYFCSSFETITAYKGNAAIVHYNPFEGDNKVLENNGLLLIDCGAHYFDGTTDITRTISLGNKTEEEMENYTLVLKGFISLSNAVFPSGTRGYQLDAFARKPLWDKGKNYGHGTGHGVGYFLNVHESYHSISVHNNNIALEPGMVTSIEPGLYVESKYGIRIENLVLIKEFEKTEFGNFFLFETLSFCPFDLSLINISNLNNIEIHWINNYHKMVNIRLTPYLDDEEKHWLDQKTIQLIV